MSNLIKLILILQILVFFINTFLGILVFRADSKSRFNILFCIYTLGLAFWNLCLFLTITAIGGSSMQLYCSRLAFSFGVILFNSFLYFALIYPNIKIIKFWIDALFILVNAVFVYLTLTPLLIAGNVQARGGFITGEFGSLMPIFSLYLPAFIFLSLVILVWKLFKYKGTIRVKIWYTAAGFAFFAVPMIITNLILPIFFQNFRYNNLGPIFSLPMVAVIAYVIIRHRFMGIRQAVARLVSYFFLVIVLGIFYAGGISLITSFLIKDPSWRGNLGISAIFTIAIAFSFQPLRSAFEKATNKIFYRHHYDENNLLYDLTLTMSSSLRLNEMNGKLLKKIIGEMHISQGAIVLVNHGRIFNLSHIGYKRPPKFSSEDLVELTGRREVVVFDELEEDRLKRTLRRLGIKIIVPLRTQKKRDNILILSEKLSGDPYTDQDIRLLEVFAPAAAVAISNTISVEQLIQLDELKSEFIAVASHQLRTPLSVARWNFELVLEGAFGHLSPKIRAIVGDTYRALMDLNQGLNNLMVALEIEERKVNMKYDQVDFNKDVLGEALSSLKKEIAAKEIKISKKITFKGLIRLDRHKIVETLKALITNSIEYSPAGSKVEIFVQAIEEDSRRKLLFSIKDQGIGVSLKNRAFIFKKFFRGEEAKELSPNGFGLSLFIARSFIEFHGGRIWLEKGDGKEPGATFSFTLPL